MKAVGVFSLYLICSWRGLRLETEASDLNDLCKQVSRGQGRQLDAEGLAQNLDLEFEVQLEVVLLVKLGQEVHDAHGPRRWRLEDPALGARFKNFGNERNDVHQLLLTNLVCLDDQRFDVQIHLKRINTK